MYLVLWTEDENQTRRQINGPKVNLFHRKMSVSKSIWADISLVCNQAAVCSSLIPDVGLNYSPTLVPSVNI